MCIWRSFGEAEAPEGALNIYQLRRLLRDAGATEAEIGEVFFALVDDEPYVTEEVLREKFPEVAKTFTNLDCSCLDKLLDNMCEITSPKPKPKEAITGRLRSNSIPEDFGSQLDLTAAASQMPNLSTIESEISLLDMSNHKQ